MATADDAADQPVATASVDITGLDVTPAECHAALDLYKLTYTPGPTRMGVVDRSPIGTDPRSRSRAKQR